MPFTSPKEESRMVAEKVTARDVEEGKIQKYIEFCQRRRLLMLSVLDCTGGDMLLVPVTNSEGEGGVSLPLSPNKVIFVDLDAWAYHYRPAGQSVAIQSWLLTERPATMGALTFSGFDEEAIYEDRSWSGPPKPQGQHTQCIAITTRAPAAVDWDFNQFGAMATMSTDGNICFPAESRFEWNSYYEPDKGLAMATMKVYVKHAAFKENDYVTLFDREFCGVKEDQIEINPAQLIVAETSYSTLVKAGYTKETMNGKHISLYLGDNTGCGDWHIHLMLHGDLRAKMERAAQKEHMAFAAVQAITAQRPLFLFGLRGVGRSYDTACSASLVATAGMQADMSCTMAASHRTQEGISMGVNTLNHIGSFATFCVNGMLSPQGRSFSFDAGGDGYCRGEGSMCMFWRRSGNKDFAMEDRDAELSHCTLLGCNANCDGRSASITAPNGPAQSKLISISMAQAGLHSDDVSASECHGTGTPLGDPIEVGALKVVWKDRTTGPMVLTSKKANISHTEANAGLTGLCSCILMLKYSIGITCPHLKALNPNIDIAGYPVSFLSENYDFRTTNAAVGVSSFGVGGTNARADVWGYARRGYLAERKVSPLKAHYVQKTCPICLGPMCWICGAAVPTNAAYGKHHCSLVRDRVTDYNFCSMCYQGEYAFGALIEDERPKRNFERVYAVGSWDGYSSMYELSEIDDGLYSCVVPMGEIGCEQFYLTLGGDRGLLYPVTDLGGAVARVEGPSSHSRGRQWLLDGRAHRQRGPGKSSGKLPSVMRINLEWHDSIKRVFWEAVDDPPTEAIELAEDDPKKSVIQQGYFITGSFSRWKLQELQRESPGVYQGSFVIGSTGFEEFQLARDIDWRQCIHPAIPTSHKVPITKAQTPVRGPDPHGHSKNWKVSGNEDEIVHVKLTVDDGRIAVSASSKSIGSRTWYSLAEGRSYYVVGSVTGGAFRLMEQSSDHPGLYLCEVDVGSRDKEFQIVIDEDATRMFYPSSKRGRLGQCFTRGPDAEGAGCAWVIDDVPSGTTVSIVLDTNQADRRSMVFWTMPESLSSLQDSHFELGDGE